MNEAETNSKEILNSSDSQRVRGCGSAACCVWVAKMTHRTNHFNEDQKVWLIHGTGDLAAYVTGRYRGKGRWVKAWIKWDTAAKPHPDFKEIEVEKDFADRHGITIFGHNGGGAAAL